MKRRILDGEFLDRLDAAALCLKSQLTGYFGGTRKARTYGNTVEFADFREYFPGDDIRRIDWNVFARFEIKSDNGPIRPLLDDIKKFTRDAEQFDDMTVLYLKIKG